MNFAGVRRLPVVFVCDNNQYAYSTPPQLEYACANLADRAAAYGFEGVIVDGTDILAVYSAAKEAIEKARAGGGPTLVECVTLRMEGHAVHDDAFYVPRELLAEWAKRDPIARFRAWLGEHAQTGEAELAELEEEVKALLVEAQRQAENSPPPDPSELEQGVYAEPEQPQENTGA
jgi:TPP-dependent pyruvate/acetoin dehydrogenase alpha subunit